MAVAEPVGWASISANARVSFSLLTIPGAAYLLSPPIGITDSPPIGITDCDFRVERALLLLRGFKVCLAKKLSNASLVSSIGRDQHAFRSRKSSGSTLIYFGGLDALFSMNAINFGGKLIQYKVCEGRSASLTYPRTCSFRPTSVDARHYRLLAAHGQRAKVWNHLDSRSKETRSEWLDA